LKACIIFNPAARGQRAERFRDQLARLSASVTLKPTYAAGSGRTLAAEAVQQGFDTIVAAGGDGTINEVLNGLSDAPTGLINVRFGVVPLGTVNVFRRELALPTEFAAAWRIIQEGRESRIDLPEVEFVANGQSQRRCFAQLLARDSILARSILWIGSKRNDWPAGLRRGGLQALAERKPQSESPPRIQKGAVNWC
jgi:diacylglycerol kinase family enzyme